jgi:hypothetical protein
VTTPARPAPDNRRHLINPPIPPRHTPSQAHMALQTRQDGGPGPGVLPVLVQAKHQVSTPTSSAAPPPRDAGRPAQAAHATGKHEAAGQAFEDACPARHGASSPNTPPAQPVRGRPWKTSGYTDRATCADAVRYASVDTAL